MLLKNALPLRFTAALMLLLCSLFGRANDEAYTDSLQNRLDSVLQAGDFLEALIEYNELGCFHQEKGNNDKALQYFLKGVRLADDQELAVKSAMLKFNIANIYFIQEDYTKALEIVTEIRSVFHREKEEELEGIAIVLQGSAYSYLDKRDSAILITLQAAEIFKRTNNSVRLSQAYNLTGTILQEQSKFEEALEYYLLSLDIDKSIGDSLNVSISYSNIGGVYGEMGDNQKALQYYMKSFEMGDPENNKQYVSTTALYIAMTYALLGDYKNAYEYQIKHQEFEQQIQEAANRENFLRIQEEYEAEKKDNAILQLKTEKEALAAKVRYRNIILILIGFTVVLAGIIVHFVLQRKRTDERMKRAELEQKALRAQMNPHFIFNCLNSIQSMFLQGDFERANDYMGDFGDLLRKILENSGKSFIRLKDEMQTLKLYLDIEKMRTSEMFDYEINTDDELDMMHINVPPLIIQPFVENAIWHGILPGEQKGKITIQLRRLNERTLQCIVTDNGIGIDRSKESKNDSNRKSMGMEITAERLNLKGAILAEQLSQGGTRVTLQIPTAA